MRVAYWPLYEMLHAFMECLRESARKDYLHAEVLYFLAAPHAKKKLTKPKRPSILNDGSDT